MRLAFYTDIGSPRNLLLVSALQDGGLDVEVFNDYGVRDGFDMHAVVGVVAKQAVQELVARDLPFLFWDKGYTRKWPEWWRVSYRTRQPLSFLRRADCPADRAAAQGWLERCKPWRQLTGGHVVFAGAEERYHQYWDLRPPAEYAQTVVRTLRARTTRRIVYRPRPKTLHLPVDGAELSSNRPIAEDLEGAHALVTHGSSACLDALLAGVPSVVLGDGVTRHVSSFAVADIGYPRVPTDREREQLLANLAYTQWTLGEISSGAAWDFIGRTMCE